MKLSSRLNHWLIVIKLPQIYLYCGYLSIYLFVFCPVASANGTVSNLHRQVAQEMPSVWDDKLKQARELRNSGNLAEAIAIYRQILLQDPQQKDAKNGLALVLAWDNQLDESIKLYQELIQEEPNNLDFLNEIGTVYTWKGDFTAAIATYQQVLKVNPSDLQAKLGLAEAYGWNNKFEEAIATYQQILQTEPDNVDLKVKIAEVLTWADRLDAALDLYEEIIEKHSPSSKALAGRAQIVFWQGKPIKAIALYQQALATFPNEAQLTLGLAQVYQAQQASDKALKLIEPLVKSRDPEATKLLETIRKSWQPKLEFGFNNLTDSDRLNVRTYTTKFKAFIDPQSQIELALARHDLNQPNFEGRTTDTYSIGFQKFIDAQWQISGGLGITDYSSTALWYLRTRWQASDKISFSAAVDRQPLGINNQAIDNNISVTSYSVGSDLNLDEKTQLGLGIGRAEFNPYNRRDGIFLYANRVLLNRPFRLDIGYLFRNLGYENSPGLGYFSPSRFTQHGALVTLDLPVNKTVSLFSRNLIGVQQIDEGDRELSLDLTAGFNWQLSDRANWRIQYHHFTISASQGGGGYKADEFSTQLVWQF